tara:strand:- start:34 stop:282 length:249 start_codon:yes stop_codon:yes gene_type:complete
MPYTSFNDLRTARNAALENSDSMTQSDRELLESDLRVLAYRKNLRGLPQKVKVDENGDAIVNIEGNLQDINDNLIELPSVPV